MYVQVNHFLNKHAGELSSHARITDVKPNFEQLIKDIGEKEGSQYPQRTGAACHPERSRRASNNFEHLPPGIYFLTLDNGEQTVSRKFVKQ